MRKSTQKKKIFHFTKILLPQNSIAKRSLVKRTIYDGTASITKNTGQESTVFISPTIKGKAVTIIGELAFSGHIELTE